MFSLLKSKPHERAEQIRAALQTAEADLAEARTALGNAVADSDDSTAATARKEVARCEQLASELRAALPVAERRVREAADREEADRIREQHKAANAARAKRVAAARAVDKALAALGKAYDAYAALPTGGTTEQRFLLARRANAALRSATHHAAPALADALGVGRIGPMHRRDLADQEANLIGELDEQ